MTPPSNLCFKATQPDLCRDDGHQLPHCVVKHVCLHLYSKMHQIVRCLQSEL